MKNRRIYNAGFSLVELIIVIAIMAVLIALLTPQFIRYIEKSRQENDMEVAAVVQDAIKVAMADTAINDRPDSFGPLPLDNIESSGTMPDFADAIAKYIGTASLVSFSSDNIISRAYKGNPITVELNLDPEYVRVTVSSNNPGIVDDIVIE